LVERWFAELTNKQLRRGAHRSVAQLEAAIREFIDAHHANLKPFVWTKTADEILASIARFAQRTLDFQTAQAAPLIARTTRSGHYMEIKVNSRRYARGGRRIGAFSEGGQNPSSAFRKSTVVSDREKAPCKKKKTAR
jgi:hypothetical protein